MIGDPILPAVEFGYRVQAPVIGPDEAIRVVVMAYLQKLAFQVPGGQTFGFARVYSRWPSPDVQLVTPSASILAAGPPDVDEQMVPRMLEETWGRFDPPRSQQKSTALWKLGEMSQSLQIDLWAGSFAEQSALMARMHGALSPGESASRVMLEGSPEYWCLPVRLSLVGMERVEVEDAMYAGEFRARMVAMASIDVAELRCATVLRVNPVLATVDTATELEEET